MFRDKLNWLDYVAIIWMGFLVLTILSLAVYALKDQLQILIMIGAGFMFVFISIWAVARIDR